MALFLEYQQGSKTIMLSDFTIQELEIAREEIRNKNAELPKKQIISLGINDEAIKLAEAYINEGALTNKSYNDALHIALATINNADVFNQLEF